MVSAVALFVVGPDRLPSAIRTVSLWLGKVRRGFEEIKADVSRELHNEEVMRALRESRNEVQDLTDIGSALSLNPVADKAPESDVEVGGEDTALNSSDSPADSEKQAQ